MASSLILMPVPTPDSPLGRARTSGFWVNWLEVWGGNALYDTGALPSGSSTNNALDSYNIGFQGSRYRTFLAQ